MSRVRRSLAASNQRDVAKRQPGRLVEPAERGCPGPAGGCRAGRL